MSIIKPHEITLYGGNDKFDIALRPLCDEHLPLLYKWNADPEVVYWVDTTTFDEENVRDIYGDVSQNELLFIIEINGIPIGDFWLQRINSSEISEKYIGLDVRRIDTLIGEKNYWGQGIGSVVLGIIIDFAFGKENIDVLYCFTADYNIRGQKTLIKHGFELCEEKDAGGESLRAKKEYHYRLTAGNYRTQTQNFRTV
jgi:RimJ/RimL family protein N-acetyltransferase